MGKDKKIDILFTHSHALRFGLFRFRGACPEMLRGDSWLLLRNCSWQCSRAQMGQRGPEANIGRAFAAQMIWNEQRLFKNVGFVGWSSGASRKMSALQALA